MKVSEIFNKKPDHWGLRGDPYLWQDMKNRLINVDMPTNVDELRKLVEKTYEEATGYPLSFQNSFVVDKFSHGGMSSGGISPEFWLNHGIPLLISRHSSIF